MENEKEESKPREKTKKPGSKNTLKNGILSIVAAVFHKLVIMPMMIFLGLSTYMISYLRYYQGPNETPISLNYSYFIMPILSITMGFGIPFSGMLEFKLGTKLAIVYSSLFLILSSVIQYFSKRIALNLLAIFTFALGFSLCIALPGKNACMYFPTRRGMITGFLSFISALFSSVLNIFGEKVIINPESIDPIRGYYIYDVAKNIKKYYLFQMGCVTIFTIITVLFIVQFNMKRGPPRQPQRGRNKRGKKKDDLLIKDEKSKEPLMPEEKEGEEKEGEKKDGEDKDNEGDKNKEEEIEVKEEKKEKKETKQIHKNELIGISGLESSIINASANYSMNQVKRAFRSFRVWRLFLMGIFAGPLGNFITITWRPISIYKNMPTNKIQVINSYTSFMQMIANPLFGFLSDKVPFRILKCTLSSINCIVGFLFYYSFTNVNFFTILIVLNSFAHFGIFSIGEPHYMKVFGMKHFIEISGIIGLSNVIMGPICSFLAFALEQKFKNELDTVYKFMFIISALLGIVDVGLSALETEDPLFTD